MKIKRKSRFALRQIGESERFGFLENLFMKKLLFFVSLTIFLTACPSTETVESTRISPKNVFQQFTVNAEKSRTTVWATFRVGDSSGKTIDLDAPSKIELNGAEMTETAPNFLSGTSYRTTYEKFTSPLQFVYTSADGRIYRNEIEFAPIEIVSKNIVLSRKTDGFVKLSRPVLSDEDISLNISGKKKDKTDDSKKLNINFDATRTSILIKAVEYNEFINGKAVLSVSFEKKVKLKQATGNGGTIDLNYRSSETETRIVN